MASKYLNAPEVEKIAQELIQKYHHHLIPVKIVYCFIDKTPVKGGKEVWGTMRKISSLPAYLATLGAPPPAEAGKGVNAEGEPETPDNEPFFCMVISKPVWDIIDTATKIALVDHELMHGGTEEQEDQSYKLVIVPHDLEEFAVIIERHGMWQSNVAAFIERAKGKISPTQEVIEIAEAIDQDS